MRLRLAHTLSLTLLAFTGVAVMAMGGLTAWKLRNGFGEYLAASDVRHFERFVNVLQARAALEGGAIELLAGRMDVMSILDELHPRVDGPFHLAGPPDDPSGPRELPPEAFPNRVRVLGSNGSVLMGSHQIGESDSVALVERPIRVNGQVVATASMRPLPVVRSGAEARFLQDQYLLLAGVGSGLIMLAVVTATALARSWVQPLSAVQVATQRLAQGELSVRLAQGPALTDRSDEIGDVVRNVNRMAEGLQQMEGARRRWLADISHELRTPLTVLRGDLEALHDGVRPLKPQAIAVLLEELLRLSRIVDDLHLLAISDLQELPCHLAKDDGVQMVKSLVERFEDRALASGLQIRFENPSAALTVAVHWDAGRMEQLLSNLLENSLRYTQVPGQVVVRLRLMNCRVQIDVEDSAPGVPFEQISQLFDPLYRGDAARARCSGGSGLGLSICKVIARAHGAYLTASPSELGGLLVTLDLPQQGYPGGAV